MLGTARSGQLRFKQRTGKDPIGVIAEALQTAWGEGDTRKGVEWPLALRVGRQREGVRRFPEKNIADGDAQGGCASPIHRSGSQTRSIRDRERGYSPEPESPQLLIPTPLRNR